MKYHFEVHIPGYETTLGVSDDAAGDDRMSDVYKQYGDCKVDISEWGKDKILKTTTIAQLFTIE